MSQNTEAESRWSSFDEANKAWDASRSLRGPTDLETDDACMWYRHDFGLLPDDERMHLRIEAKEWLRAWCKVRDFVPPSATTAALTDPVIEPELNSQLPNGPGTTSEEEG